MFDRTWGVNRGIPSLMMCDSQPSEIRLQRLVGSLCGARRLRYEIRGVQRSTQSE